MVENNYESGWYRFASSKKIKKNIIYSYHYFDKPLICYRDQKNIVNIFDAHCPHLGAHLGVGGKIQNDRLVCPFHGWQYDFSGKCVEIPYCKVIPKKAMLKRYQSYEDHSAVYIHYSAPCLDFPFLGAYKAFWTLELENTALQKWINFAKNELNCEWQGPGFLCNQKAGLLISLTPSTSQQVTICFSYSSRSAFNFLSAFLLKWKIKKIVGC